MSSSLPLDPSLIKSYQNVVFTTPAAIALLLYDILLTLDEEIQLVWKSPNTPPKFLFFVSRYFGVTAQLVFFSSLLSRHCELQSWLRLFSYIILHWCAELTLVIRIYALWDRRQWVGYFLFSLFAASQINIGVIAVLTLTAVVSAISPVPDDWPVSGCIGTRRVPGYFAIAWINLLVLHSILFVMSGFKCLPSQSFSRIPLVIRVFRDGTIYFFLMLVVSILRLIGGYQPKVVNFAIIDSWIIVVFSMTGSHLTLNVRSLVAERQRKYMGTDMTLTMPECTTGQYPSQLGAQTQDPTSLALPRGVGNDIEAPPEANCGEIPIPEAHPDPLTTNESGPSHVPPAVTFDIPSSRRGSIDRSVCSLSSGETSANGHELRRRHSFGLRSWRNPSWLDEWGTKL